ncbi:flagellin [Sulfoacidibacillus ferrooxidans]|uniref:Flagellin n=1 Tax=Sulfoacidibacillus ferrooxidans TaxID=2005001 RepID=A0A9X1V864_9BACL|nr:flagellin [Sulfoacidibacillus ferrooxidans]MCI0183481.1 B-type flagellin [Sulfoacidibacillus ferrooxidans]
MSVNFSVNNNAQAQSILQNLNDVQNNINSEYSALSTGNSVNSAADNPAGYAISQQMTSQVNGLNQATQNSQNGISMIQTATGAMNQVETIMQTMSSLATEASTAGMSYSDRANLQLEMNSLAQQINSTTNQTQYNGINLLSGQFASSSTTEGTSNLTIQAGANQNQTLSFNIAATDVNTLNIAGTSAAGIALSSGSISTGVVSGTNGASFSGSSAENFVTTAANQAITFSNSTIFQSGQQFKIAISANVSSTSSGASVTSETLQLQTENGNDIGNAVSISVASATSGGTVTLGDSATGAQLTINLNEAVNAFTVTSGSSGTFNGVISFTATGGTASQAGSQLNNWQASSSVVGLNIMNQSSAQNAITSIHNALNQLSSQQAQLGAVQNQLNYTVSDLQNSSENLQNAKSTITNTNMAAEYTQFSQNQILDQVGQSMLSQADQQPASILKLLQ